MNDEPASEAGIKTDLSVDLKNGPGCQTEEEIVEEVERDLNELI